MWTTLNWLLLLLLRLRHPLAEDSHSRKTTGKGYQRSSAIKTGDLPAEAEWRYVWVPLRVLLIFMTFCFICLVACRVVIDRTRILVLMDRPTTMRAIIPWRKKERPPFRHPELPESWQFDVEPLALWLPRGKNQSIPSWTPLRNSSTLHSVDVCRYRLLLIVYNEINIKERDSPKNIEPHRKLQWNHACSIYMP